MHNVKCVELIKTY